VREKESNWRSIATSRIDKENVNIERGHRKLLPAPFVPAFTTSSVVGALTFGEDLRFQAARGSDGSRTTPKSEIEAPM
jgi:hypothetical protein